jgi:hypothetical protein
LAGFEIALLFSVSMLCLAVPSGFKVALAPVEDATAWSKSGSVRKSVLSRTTHFPQPAHAGLARSAMIRTVQITRCVFNDILLLFD